MPFRKQRTIRRAVEARGELVSVACQGLCDARRVVEADEPVGDHEAAFWEIRACVRKRHCRLEPRDVVVAEVADHRPARGDLRLRLRERDEPRA